MPLTQVLSNVELEESWVSAGFGFVGRQEIFGINGINR
jgi:hypothetical protein